MPKAKIIHRGKFITYLKKGRYEYIERQNCSGIIIIVAVNDEGKLIFVEQFRPPVNSQTIEFPAGLVGDDEKKGESYKTAAKRELLEETGYKAKKVVKLMSGPVSGGSASDLITMVQAIDIKKVASGGGDDTEDIIIHEVPLIEVLSWLKSMEKKGCLVEPKIYAGLFFLNTYNKNLKK
jgi:ADP-ribose pyrophosphatase